MLVSAQKSPKSKRKQPIRSSWVRRALLASALAPIVLGACSLALDFDAPSSPEQDGGAVDATTAIDAMPLPDSAPVLACNASDNELEVNNTQGTATALGSEIMSVLCTEANGTQDVDFFQFLIGLKVTEDIQIDLSQRNGERVGMRLRDGAETILVVADGPQENNRITRRQADGQLLPSGTYFIEVFYPTTTFPKAEYTLTLQRTSL